MSNSLADELNIKNVEIEVYWPRVLVERVKPPEKTESGIYIAEAVQQFHAPPRGIVRAVGRIDIETGEEHEPVIAEGDLVQFGRMSGTDFDHGDVRYKMLTLRDISMKIIIPEGSVDNGAS